MNQNFKEPSGLINRQAKELVGIYRDAVKLLGISNSEFWIWYTLIATKGDCTQQDICGTWSLPKQTVNTIITKLRLKKYVYLEAVPGTRNHKVIRLTDAGRTYGEGLILPITQAEKKAFDKISPDELDMVTKILEKYIEIVQSELDEAAK